MVWCLLGPNFVLCSAHMAQGQDVKEESKLSSYDAYFETIQSRKKLPHAIQETLTLAFANIPVSSFPLVPGGKGKCINNYCLGKKIS